MRSSSGSRILRASSGSRSASSSIEPLTSAKSTVTCLRSPSSAVREARIFSARCLGVEYFGGSAASAIRHPAPRRARSARLHGDWSMSWQRPFKELNPKVEELIVKVLEEGKGAGQSPEWQTLGSVTQLDCHNPLCQRGGVDLYQTLREMVATRRAELENVKMCRGIEGGGSSAAPRHCLNRFAFRISLAYEAEGHR